ncbi:unnamed protein product [Psylliodes chrysocephalus]|uniref:Uncharacterized protein n=1 Tax=Psylliodes chrysocephalus TaxID=3402493 RepID=A0A9P0CWE6_9CUCU|nr:unnamed protein product [Psylliodes chrysocephala]
MNKRTIHILLSIVVVMGRFSLGFADINAGISDIVGVAESLIPRIKIPAAEQALTAITEVGKPQDTQIITGIIPKIVVQEAVNRDQPIATGIVPTITVQEAVKRDQPIATGIVPTITVQEAVKRDQPIATGIVPTITVQEAVKRDQPIATGIVPTITVQEAVKRDQPIATGIVPTLTVQKSVKRDQPIVTDENKAQAGNMRKSDFAVNVVEGLGGLTLKLRRKK